MFEGVKMPWCDAEISCEHEWEFYGFRGKRLLFRCRYCPMVLVGDAPRPRT